MACPYCSNEPYRSNCLIPNDKGMSSNTKRFFNWRKIFNRKIFNRKFASIVIGLLFVPFALGMLWILFPGMYHLGRFIYIDVMSWNTATWGKGIEIPLWGIGIITSFLFYLVGYFTYKSHQIGDYIIYRFTKK